MTLGVVLTPYGKVPGAYPWEINKSAQGSTTFLCEMDPYYFQRGEYGFFHDTPFGAANGHKKTLFQRLKQAVGIPSKNGLGAVPTDAEIGKYYYNWYTPVQSAWIYAIDPKRYIPPPWVPPDNWRTASPYGPQTAFAGTHVALLGDAPMVPSEAPEQPTVSTPATPAIAQQKAASAQDVVTILNEYHRKQFWLSAVATMAGVGASAFAIFRTLKGIQDDSRERARRAAPVTAP